MLNKNKPEQTYKDFLDFCHKKRILTSGPNPTFICSRCHGNKKIISPDEFCDPVEGYKMADRITCPKCGGTGEGSKKEYKKKYKEIKRKDKENIKEWEECFNIFQSGWNKLNEEEKEVFIKFGFKPPKD